MSSQQSQLKEDFTILFGGKKFPVVKFKASLYSRKFRELVAGTDLTSLTIDVPIKEDYFVQFVNAIQGEEYTITSESVYDLFSLSLIWKVDTLYSELRSFIDEGPDISMVIKKLLSTDQKLVEGLDEIIALNFDRALKNDKFANLPLEFILKCVDNPNIKIKDQSNYFKFVQKMLQMHGKPASALSKGIDFYYLTRDEAIAFLDNPNLDPVIAADTLIKLTKLYVSETTLIESKIEKMYNSVSQMHSPSTSVDTILKCIDLLMDDITGLVQKVNSGAKTFKNDVSEIETHLVSMEKRAKDERRKQDKEIEDFRGQLKILENKYEQTKEIISEQAVPGSPKSPKSPQKSLIIDEQETETPLANRHLTNISFNAEEPLNGVLSSLAQLANGNVSENGIVKITSSSSDHGCPWQVADRGWNNYWFSQNKAGQFILFDFMQRQIVVNKYTIKTIKFSEDSCHLKTWAMEASNDLINWAILDERDTNELNGSNKVVSFDCQSGNNVSYRYVRLRMTGPNARGDNLLALNNMEFFGVLVDL